MSTERKLEWQGSKRGKGGRKNWKKDRKQVTKWELNFPTGSCFLWQWINSVTKIYWIDKWILKQALTIRALQRIPFGYKGTQSERKRVFFWDGEHKQVGWPNLLRTKQNQKPVLRNKEGHHTRKWGSACNYPCTYKPICIKQQNKWIYEANTGRIKGIIDTSQNKRFQYLTSNDRSRTQKVNRAKENLHLR